MDSHITGPRGRGYGAVTSASGIGAIFSSTAQTGKEILRTTGASATNPLLVRIDGVINTAFNGTTPIFRLFETNLDGTGSIVIANIADFTAGKFSLVKALMTVDKIYLLLFNPGSPASTAGAGAYFIEVCGPGILP